MYNVVFSELGHFFKWQDVKLLNNIYQREVEISSPCIIRYKSYYAQSAEAVEYTDCFSAECPGYDTKQSDSVVPGECWVPLHYHRSQVHSGPEW